MDDFWKGVKSMETIEYESMLFRDMMYQNQHYLEFMEIYKRLNNNMSADKILEKHLTSMLGRTEGSYISIDEMKKQPEWKATIKAMNEYANECVKNSSNAKPKTPSVKDEIMAILPYDDKITEFVENNHNLYTAYSVRNKDGNFTSVIDVKSVVDLLREVLN